MYLDSTMLNEWFDRVHVRKSLHIFSNILLVCALLLAPAYLCAQNQDIEINETNFPDANFRAYVNKQYGKNGVLPGSTVVSSMVLDRNSITDLTGLKFFPELTSLSCRYNTGLTSVDLSVVPKLQKLLINGCKVTSLDFTHNPDMTNIDCTSMKTLTKIDVSKCTNLQYLSLGDNKLQSLDVTKNTNLKQLSIYTNDLSSIDLSNNTALTKLYAFQNPKLTSLDLSHNTKLQYLSVYNNNMPTLDVSMLPQLQTLYCFNTSSNNTMLTQLDVTKNPALLYLSCYKNNLTQLDLSKNPKLKSLLCFNNKLTKLDLSVNTDLVDVSCQDNQLTNLVLPSNQSLVALDCHDNKLASLSIPSTTANNLQFVSISNNALSSIDLSGFSNLNSSYKSKINDMSYTFSNASAATQRRRMMLYTDGNDAYMLVGGGINVNKISGAKINIGNNSTDVTFSLGDTNSNGLVPLKFSNGAVRKRLFNWTNSTATPITITYNYDTGSTLDGLKTMDVTDTVECYLMPMSQEYGSVNLPYDVLLPEGATAYAISATNANTITLTEIATAGDIVKANTPMLIRRSNSSTFFALNQSTGTAKTATLNLLKGTQDAAIDNKDSYFVLGINNTAVSANRGKLGFWRSSYSKIGNWRAYLDMGTASQAKGFFLVLDTDTPTGISRIGFAGDRVDAPWYTLDGRVMGAMPAQRGIYVHNGKKVIIK